MGVRSDSSVREIVRDGAPRLVIDFRYQDEEGRRRRYRRDATVQLADAAYAEAQRLKVQAVTTGHVVTKPPAMLFRDFATGPFTHRYMAMKCRPATRERYEALLRQGVLNAFGSLRLDEIHAPEFCAYDAELAGRGIQSRPHLSLVRTVLKAAFELGALEKMPALPRLPHRRKKSPSAPSPEEVAVLLAHATGWLRIAIALAAYGGLAIGEMGALEVRDIDLRAGKLTVRRAISAADVMPPKSGESRVVPIVPELQSVVEHVVERRAPNSRVLLNAAGRTPRRQHALAALKRLQAKCELRQLSFQAMRLFAGAGAS